MELIDIPNSDIQKELDRILNAGNVEIEVESENGQVSGILLQTSAGVVHFGYRNYSFKVMREPDPELIPCITLTLYHGDDDFIAQSDPIPKRPDISEHSFINDLHNTLGTLCRPLTFPLYEREIRDFIDSTVTWFEANPESEVRNLRFDDWELCVSYEEIGKNALDAITETAPALKSRF